METWTSSIQDRHISAVAARKNRVPPVVAVDSLPETIRGVQCFGSSGLNTLSEYADISSAAAADLSVESFTILDHTECRVDTNLIDITPVDTVLPSSSL